MGDQSNNFGNLRPKSNKGFMEFATAKEGINAMADRMTRYANGITTEANPTGKPAKTLLEFTSIYAPKQDKNDPVHYAQVLGDRLGLDINQEINLKDPALQKAMIPHIMHMENSPRATKALQRPEVQGALNSLSDSTFDPPVKQAPVKSTGSAPAAVIAPPAKPIGVAAPKEITPVDQTAVVQEAPIQQAVPVQKDAPVVVTKDAPTPVVNTPPVVVKDNTIVNAPQENPMEALKVAEPVTPEALQYIQAQQEQAPVNIMEALASFGEGDAQAPTLNMNQIAQMKNRQAMQQMAKAANLGEGLESPITQIAGTNEQVQQIKADSRPMETFKQILAQQQAEAMNYG